MVKGILLAFVLLIPFMMAGKLEGKDMKNFQKPSKEELEQKLSKEQFEVTQEEGTEKPFKNQYWDNKKPGIYVDVVSGEPLFSSLDKFDSGSGWPSFTRPLVKEHIVEKSDRKLFMTRTEVRSKHADSHLGHVFDDGPAPTGLRYCVNSASLRFIPAEKLEEEGYGEYAELFKGKQETRKAVFAGGCFWCMEPPYEKMEGVISVVSGYTGGHKENPKYEEVSSGSTGHVEAIEITYDPNKVSYQQLLEVFWRNIDPTDGGGQFADRGEQYRAVIFYNNEEEKKVAEKSKEELQKSGVFQKPVQTLILPGNKFYSAEDYHQDYYKKNPIRYKYYRYGSGRDDFLEKNWGTKK